MPARIRQRVIRACEAEIKDIEADSDRYGWLYPEKRITCLRKLIRRVEKYQRS